MKTILLLHDESGSPKPRFQNVAYSKVTQRASEGTPGCNCDRWGHPYPDRVEHNVHAGSSRPTRARPRSFHFKSQRNAV
jgi:hypothetical protein